MTRPTVQIASANVIDRLRAHLDTQLPHLIALPGVAGITLNGGLSRGYGDHLSEIDLTLFLTPETYATWQSGHAPIGTGIVMRDGMLYDIKAVDLAHEEARQWEPVTLWDASYAEILHDPEGVIAALLADKLATRPDPGSAGGPLFGAWWHFKLAGDIWLHRGDAAQGHLMLNAAVIDLLKALLIANREYTPHEKWLLHLSRGLTWTPDNWAARLDEAMTVRPTLEHLRERQGVIAALWDEIDRYAHAQAAGDLPVRVSQRWHYDLLNWLAEAGSVSVEAFAARAGLDMLNQAPLHGIARIEGARVVIDRDALLTTPPDAMYAWHYEVLAAVRAAQSSG